MSTKQKVPPLKSGGAGGGSDALLLGADYVYHGTEE